ncbi:mitochondrial carrier [Violaceomyces palustris]|uniref:Mitochondrial carrier n=1 Tax=Violaceomyces palustris TaxID=1673888 RepID=A0ACD0P1X1_9BASI|nr:mitochondrial carrier [Violaceomyces palustris]
MDMRPATTSRVTNDSTWAHGLTTEPLSTGTLRLASPSKDERLGDLSPLTRPLRRAQAWWESRKPSEQEINKFLLENRTIVTAGTASLVSTIAAFPFDSLKSRLQVKDYPSIWACARAVVREEGIRGFFRGVTIPLITISFVRTSSFSIYFNTKNYLHQRGYLADPTKLSHTALSGMAGGATSGIIISCGSAPFELVKVQRQLEYLIAVQKGVINSQNSTFVPQSGFKAAANILKNHGGPKGFYMGFPLHMMRDTMGTALYFGFYDSIRSIVSKYSTGDRKTGPQLFGLPGPVVSFLSGSSAGIASWLIVYPVDLIKTKVQRDALAGNPRLFTGWQVFLHMIKERPTESAADRGDGQEVGIRRGKDTVLRRFLRLYRGLGVSALRSFISHGLTWTLIEGISQKISERTGTSVSYIPDTNDGRRI